MSPAKRLAVVAAVALLLLAGAGFYWREHFRTVRPAAAAPAQGARPDASHRGGTRADVLPANDRGATGTDADFPLAARLNAPDSSLARDLDIVRQIFEAWQSNFPHDGNPVGENAEITAALMGENRLELALIPKGHRAVNERGELCDRWGTPFRFHQLSGTRMEIRSAGPDRKFATEDDGVWTPP